MQRRGGKDEDTFPEKDNKPAPPATTATIGPNKEGRVEMKPSDYIEYP